MAKGDWYIVRTNTPLGEDQHTLPEGAKIRMSADSKEGAEKECRRESSKDPKHFYTVWPISKAVRWLTESKKH